MGRRASWVACQVPAQVLCRVARAGGVNPGGGPNSRGGRGAAGRGGGGGLAGQGWGGQRPEGGGERARAAVHVFEYRSKAAERDRPLAGQRPRPPTPRLSTSTRKPR